MALWDATGEPAAGCYEVRWLRASWSGEASSKVFESVADMLEVVRGIIDPDEGYGASELVYLQVSPQLIGTGPPAKVSELGAKVLGCVIDNPDTAVSELVALSGVPERSFWRWRARLLDEALIAVDDAGCLVVTDEGDRALHAHTGLLS